MAEQVKNQVFVLEPISDAADKLLTAIQEGGQADVHKFTSPDEVMQSARQFTPCLVVVTVSGNAEIPVVYGLLKKLQGDMKAGNVKTLCLTLIKNAQLQKVLSEVGVADYVVEPVPVRSLQFKLNLQLKALDTIRRQRELKKQSEERVVIKSGGDKKSDDPLAGGVEVKSKLKPALKMADDTFLIKSGAIRKRAKKYVVEMDGPDPETGEWKNDGKTPEGEDQWRWTPKAPEGEPEVKDEGDGWVAKGERPQFNPSSQKWQMHAEKPELAFKKRGVKLATKVRTDEAGEVEVAEDSPEAEENLKKNRELAKLVKEKKKKKLASAVPQTKEEKEKEEKEKAELELKKKEKAPGKSGFGGASPEEEKEKKDREELKLKGKTQTEKAGGLTGKLGEEKAESDAKVGGGKLEGEGAEALGKPRELKTRAPKKKKIVKKIVDGKEIEEEVEADDEPEELEQVDPVTGAKRPAPLARASREPKRRDDAKKELEKEEAEEEKKKPAALRLLEKKKRAEAGKLEEPEAEEDEEDLEEIPGEDAVAKEMRALKLKRKKEKAARKAQEAAGLGEGEDGDDDAGKGRRALARAERRKNRDQKKAKLQDEISESLSKPIPEEVPEAEEARLRKKYQKKKEEASVKDLLRRERLEEVKKRRDDLDALEKEDEEDLAEENRDLKRLGLDEEKRGLNVYDTDEEPPPEEDDGDGRLKKLTKAQREGRREKAPEEEETPGKKQDEGGGEEQKKPKARRANASAGGGDAESDDLDPIDGDGEGESEGEDLGGPLKDGESIAERDEKRRSRKSAGGQADTLEDLFAPKDKKDDDGESLRDRRGKDEKGAEKKIRDRRGDEDEEKSGKEMSAEGGEDLTWARDRRGGGEEERESEDLSRKRTGKKENGGAEEDEAPEAREDGRGKKKNPDENAENAEQVSARREDEEIGATESLKKRQDDDASTEELRKRPDDEPSEGEEELRKRRDGEHNDGGEDLSKRSDDEGNGEDLSKRSEFANEDFGRKRSERPETGEDLLASQGKGDNVAAEKESSLDQKLADLGSKSASMQRFLERRKAREEAGRARGGQASSETGSSFLGLFVALSDAYIGKSEERRLMHVLRSIEATFENCRAVIAGNESDGTLEVLQAPSVAPGEKIPMSDCLRETIVSPQGETAPGSLVLWKQGNRDKFNEAEAAAARKVAAALWPLVRPKGKEAA